MSVTFFPSLRFGCFFFNYTRYIGRFAGLKTTSCKNTRACRKKVWPLRSVSCLVLLVHVQGRFEINGGQTEIGIPKTEDKTQLRKKVNRQTSRRYEYPSRRSKKPLRTKMPWCYVRLCSNEGPVFTFSLSVLRPGRARSARPQRSAED